jgi:hypothetical protein
MVMPASGQTIVIKRAWVSQFGSTTSAQQRVQLGFKASAYQSTMTATTPQKLKSSDPASLITGAATIAAGTAALGISTGTEGAGTFTPIYTDAFNVLNGWLWVPTPDELIMLNSASNYCFTVYLPTAAGTTSNWNAGVIFAELG